MNEKVLSFKTALQEGFRYSEYSFEVSKIPFGTFDAILDYKIWAKRVLAINAYFTKVMTGDKFVLTVYCDRETGTYFIKNSLIDFSGCSTGIIYKIVVAKTRRNTPVLSSIYFETN